MISTPRFFRCAFSVSLLAFFVVSTSLLYGQTRSSPRLLVCNEKRSVTDTQVFPRNAQILGQQERLAWHFFIGDQRGRYVLTLRSSNPFDVDFFTSEGSVATDQPWRKDTTLPPSAQPRSNSVMLPNNIMTTMTSYEWMTSFDNSRRFSSPGLNLFVAAWPTTQSGYRSSEIRATWFTDLCEGAGPGPLPPRPDSQPPATQCRWAVEQFMGAGPPTCVCRCGTKLEADARCGAKPRNCP